MEPAGQCIRTMSIRIETSYCPLERGTSERMECLPELPTMEEEVNRKKDIVQEVGQLRAHEIEPNGTRDCLIIQEHKNNGANLETSSSRRSRSPLNPQYLWEEQQVFITQRTKIGLARPLIHGDMNADLDSHMASQEEFTSGFNNSQLLLCC